MRTPLRLARPSTLLGLLLCLLPVVLSAHDQTVTAREMTTTARNWLDSLTPAQRREAVIAFADGERLDWHYVPRSRRGLPLGQMDAAQEKLARRLLASALSEEGLLQAEAVIALEDVLRDLENSTLRDRGLYCFTVFGEPGDPRAWGWRVEGHHLSLNFTLVGGRHIAATPLFVGANPAGDRPERSQQRPLAAEEDLARALLRSLNDAQIKRAHLSVRTTGDIQTRAQEKVTALPDRGLRWPELTPAQQGQLRALVEVYARRLRPELSAAEIEAIAWEELSFAFSGSLESGAAHYYRIQGQDFLIEYDNSQNGADHIHTVWRKFDGDFGRDLLREHLEKDHGMNR